MNAIRNFFDAILSPFRMLARIPSNVISSPRRMLGMSLPVRASLLLFVALLIITLVWILLRVSLDDRAQIQSFFRRELPMIVMLVFAIPAITWYALKLWLEGEPSPFPEIDQVWEKALSVMREYAVDPSETPIFVVVGPPDAASAERLINSANIALPVKVPAGVGPLHVYANSQAIYVVCTECSCTGMLLGSRGESPAIGSANADMAAPASATATMSIGGLGMSSRAEANPGPTEDSTVPGFFMSPGDSSDVEKTQIFSGPALGFNAGRTAALGDASGPMRSIRAHADTPAAPVAGAAMRGTMDVGGLAGPIAEVSKSKGGQSIARLDLATSQQATLRLAYLCRCIRRLRDPLCPINGVLVATPFKLLADGNEEAVNQMQAALKSDLATLRSAMRIRCSVIHVIADMDDEPGFRELIRRVGTDRASTQRFGKGIGLWNVPTKTQLEAVVKHACGAFEDWSYLLFREQDGLSKRGNRHLYGLLCRVRSTFAPRLAHLIESSYAIAPEDSSLASKEPLLFSGCYFSANGITPDRQAFAGSVFRKLQSEEEELQWGGEAIAEENRMQAGVQVLLILNGALIATLVAMLFYSYQISN